MRRVHLGGIYVCFACLLACLRFSVQAQEERSTTTSNQQALGEELLAISGRGSVEEVLDAATHAVSDRIDLIRPKVPEAVPSLHQELRNIESSREILAILDGHEDPLVRVVESARSATRLQAEQLGLVLLDEINLPVASPAALGLTIAERHEVILGDSQYEQLATLDSLGDAQRAALASTLGAYLAFDAAARDFADFYDPSVGIVSAEDSLGRLFSARAALAETSIALGDAFAVEVREGPSLVPPTVDLCPALALDPLGTNTLYTADCALIIDVAGNDTYHNNGGGSDFLGGGCASLSRGAAAVIDLLGDDQYGNPSSRRECGVNGGGYSGDTDFPGVGATPGVGFLLDGQGSDDYVAGRNGTNGGGYAFAGAGFGFLLDAMGDYDYDAYSHGTNGGGFGSLGAGFGLLLDGGGDDDYEVLSEGTNGGAYSKGGTALGLLLDAGGSDDYIAGGNGTNGGGFSVPSFQANTDVNGGTSLGFLLDAGDGTNTFDAGSLGTNGGASARGGMTTSSAVGYLLQGIRGSTFSADSHGTNGGAHGGSLGVAAGVAVGTLLSTGTGLDDYGAGGFGTNGGAYADSVGAVVGLLIDADNHDEFDATSRGTNGGARGKDGGVAAGLLLNVIGNDEYSATTQGVNGGGSWGTGGFAAGLLVDGNGWDTYQDSEGGTGTNKTVIPKEDAGVQLDLCQGTTNCP